MVLSHNYGQLHYLKPQAGDNQSLTTSIFHEREGTFYELELWKNIPFLEKKKKEEYTLILLKTHSHLHTNKYLKQLRATRLK